MMLTKDLNCFFGTYTMDANYTFSYECSGPNAPPSIHACSLPLVINNVFIFFIIIYHIHMYIGQGYCQGQDMISNSLARSKQK